MFESIIDSSKITYDNKHIKLEVDRDKAHLFMNELKDTKYDVEIKQHREKRSLSANGLCWVLCQKIASAINSSKDEVYESMIKRYGPFIVYPCWEEILEDLLLNFKYYQVINARYYKNDKAICDVKVYKGSSNYNTKEMSDFINNIVDECKLLKINIIDQAEIDSLINSWRG